MPVASAALIVEVADTTLATYLVRKATLYAAADVPEYWVVDLKEDRILCHAEPGADAYTDQVDVPFWGYADRLLTVSKSLARGWAKGKISKAHSKVTTRR